MHKVPKVLQQAMDKYGKEFKGTFGVDLSVFVDKRLIIFGIFGFDIIKFDDYMKLRGYDIERDGSLNDYVLKRYGKKAVDLVLNLIEYDNKGVK